MPLKIFRQKGTAVLKELLLFRMDPNAFFKPPVLITTNLGLRYICISQKPGESFYYTEIGRKLKCTYVKSPGLGDIILPFVLKKKKTTLLLFDVSLLY